MSTLALAGSQISDGEFRDLRAWIYRRAGINLSDQKKALVCGRLAPRMRHYRLTRFADYFHLLQNGAHPGEPQVAVDLLTTNETHFFREPRHFDFVRDHIVPEHRTSGRPLRVWSAACSSGEEPYSIAMTLARAMGGVPWDVLASDLSSRVLDRARRAHYPIARAGTIPREHLLAHCLRGTGAHEGTFIIDPEVAGRVRFMQVNLNEALPRLGEFDLVFLRNVMIYFDAPTKQQVVQRILACLRPGGHLVIGHAESLAMLSCSLRPVSPSIYRKP